MKRAFGFLLSVLVAVAVPAGYAAAQTTTQQVAKLQTAVRPVADAQVADAQTSTQQVADATDTASAAAAQPKTHKKTLALIGVGVLIVLGLLFVVMRRRNAPEATLRTRR
jgi:LPXTG-motif cell wall-anchored protein